MARARSPNRDKAFEIYKEHNGNITNREIAKLLDISEKTISGWKFKDKWNEKLNGVLRKTEWSTPNKNNAKKNEKYSTKKVESLEGALNDESIELTEKQRLFCIYYIENFNATKAYQKAYDCDYPTAMTNSSRMLRNAKVKAEINRLTEECLQEECINAKLLNKKVFQEYIKLAFSDITDYVSFGNKEVVVDVDEKGNEVKANINFVDFNSSDQVDGTLINEVKKGKDGVSIKLNDKMAALKWLSDRINLFTDAERHKFELDKAKLDLEITKTELAILKQGGDEGEVEDDGFIEALNAQVEEVWDDEVD